MTTIAMQTVGSVIHRLRYPLIFCPIANNPHIKHMAPKEIYL